MPEVAIEALQAAIKNLHGCGSVWVSAVPVTEVSLEQVVWQGEVQVFDLVDHPKAKRCYAWSHETETGKRRFVAVLHRPPVDSPQAAVRAAIVEEFGEAPE